MEPRTAHGEVPPHSRWPETACCSSPKVYATVDGFGPFARQDGIHAAGLTGYDPAVDPPGIVPSGRPSGSGTSNGIVVC